MTRTQHASQATTPPLQGSLSTNIGQGAQGRTDRRTDGSLYTPEERRRRDESIWTLVQGVLAPLQFLVFIVSLGLVVRTLTTGEGAFAADISIIVKTLILYTIMVTGSIWEKVVFGKWLFVEAFFWEDVFSMLVLALHTAYLVMLFGAIGTVEQRLGVALAAYAAYVINAGQFLWKLRMARLHGANAQPASGAVPA
ncbi:MAG: 2-vinyl bacteriochlorophyllide hydratase [Pseudomonadota bacterium]